ncbi:hypothetical protein IMCC21224_1929 [Puniceibacterium sp. IMCC21224]|nr:hypothetical protein IMCC21224_1929 [Puniceibacterium sp. IMCC21224]
MPRYSVSDRLLFLWCDFWGESVDAAFQRPMFSRLRKAEVTFSGIPVRRPR